VKYLINVDRSNGELNARISVVTRNLNVASCTKCSIIGYLGKEGKDEWFEGDMLESS